MRINIFTIAGENLGYGHLQRMRILQRVANERNWDSRIYLFSNENYTKVPPAVTDVIPYLKSLSAAVLKKEEIFLDADIIILDMSHPDLSLQIKELEAFLLLAVEHEISVFFIDSPGSAAVVKKFEKPNCFTYIYPYANKVGNLPKNARAFQGPHLAILDLPFEKLTPNEIKQDANKILLTFGGSDPKHLTLLAIEALEHILQKYTVRIILGPLFSEQLINEIKAKVNSPIYSGINFELIKSPDSLIPHFAWCDFAISSSGLTKYELAACGTPSILLSIDLLHHELNQSFISIGSAIDFGLSRSPKDLADLVTNLAENKDQRFQLSQAGQSVIDGQGTSRVLDIIQEVYASA